MIAATAPTQEGRASVTTPPPGEPDVVLVDDAERVEHELERLGEGTIGVDVERADGDRYHRHAALVQVGVAGRCVLLDGMALDGLEVLDTFLAERTTVLHASTNDVVPLATRGVRPRRLADTATAAAVLGRPIGLGALLADVLGVDLGEDTGRFQRADWEARPLSDEMLAYAAGDVVHLPELWSVLDDELARTERRPWYEQELEAAVANAHADDRDWTRVKGAARLSPEQRAVVRRVWEVREELARTHDIAPNVLLHDDVIATLATDPPRTAAKLVQRVPRHRAVARRFATELLAAIEEGRAAEPEPSRGGGRRWTDADRAVQDAMRKRRAAIAVELGIEPGVLCPSRPLAAVAAGEPDGPDELVRLAGLRPWQAALLAEPLWAAYEEARSGAAD
jgi:ribonuclease D